MLLILENTRDRKNDEESDQDIENGDVRRYDEWRAQVHISWGVRVVKSLCEETTSSRGFNGLGLLGLPMFSWPNKWPLSSKVSKVASVI